MKRTPIVNRHKANRIAIYNHKGGVGKTTLSFNIALALSEMGKRVLLVDADPQCNLTSFLVDDKMLDLLLDTSDNEDGNTIWSTLKPLTEFNDRTRDIPGIETNHKNIILLPGDIQLSKFETDLYEAWIDCLQRKPKGFMLVTAISEVVNKLCYKYKIDYVFYDSGPNIGPLNRVILLDCDYFIIPMACDLFSLRALKTLGHTLINWMMDWRTINSLAPDGLYLFSGSPDFLGYIPQKFRVYRGQPTKMYSGVLPKMEKHIFSNIVTPLRRFDNSLAKGNMNIFKLGQIQDFLNLANQAQQMGLPMWKAQGGISKQEEIAYDKFEQVAANIISRVEQ